jgi:hypothetical protein
VSTLFSRLTAGLGAFRDAWLSADAQRQQSGVGNDFDAFGTYEARKFRYDLFWGMYQNNTFRDLAHTWSPSLKAAFSLYRHTRNVFNPVNRLIEFHASHVQGGQLDKDAGDGEKVRSAIPILTENEAIRPAVAKLWRDSNWQTAKAIQTRYGACFGDVAVVVDDDPIRKRVTKRVIHPGFLKWVDFDASGNVTSYILEEYRYDPRAPGVKDLPPIVDPRSLHRVVRYNEEAFSDGGDVVYRTYLNGAPFNWRGNDESGNPLPWEWRVPYPFVPLVLAQHLNVGLPWGVAEPHALISKVFEVDDMASGLGDQIRKCIRAPKLIAGVMASAPVGPGVAGQPSIPGTTATLGRPDPSRQEQGFLTASLGTTVHDMAFPLDIDGVSAHIAAINAEIEKDFPELQMDIWAVNTDVSGRALRVARQRTEVKVQERRVAYDALEVKSNKLALAIGGARGYPGYQGFGHDPREEGPLDHEVGHRAVFSPDPLDDTEEAQAFWTMATAAVTAGMPLEVLLEREGWDPGDVAKVAKAKAEAMQQQTELLNRARTTSAVIGEKAQPGGVPNDRVGAH